MDDQFSTKRNAGVAHHTVTAFIALFFGASFFSTPIGNCSEPDPPHVKLALETNAKNISQISIEYVWDEVNIVPSPSDKLRVEFQGEGLEDRIEVVQSEKQVLLRGKQNSVGTTIVVSGQSTVHIQSSNAGRSSLTVNGHEIHAESPTTIQTTDKPSRVILQVPQNLSLSLRHSGKIVARAPLNSVTAEGQGTADAKFDILKELHLNVGGSSTFRVREAGLVDASLHGASSLELGLLRGTSLKASLSDSSKLRAEVNSNSLALTLSGASSAFTKGEVTGDLSVSASDASRFQHLGKVDGSIHQEKSGAAQIEISNK